jgi:hypothetical protein
MALALDGAAEGSHMGAVDFRVGGRIFATLASIEEGLGTLMLTPEVQDHFVGDAPVLFAPVRGEWGRQGATHVRLAEVPPDVLEGALRTAWRLRIERNTAAKGGRASRTRRPRGSR